MLQAIAESFERRARGSSCVVRDDDQDSCNDCLWLNCTVTVSSAVGTVTVAFHTRFFPCYSYNNSADINIHVTNNSLFAGMGTVLLTTFFAERTDAVMVWVDLAGFRGIYTVSFTLEQLGHGIMFGVRYISLCCVL